MIPVLSKPADQVGISDLEELINSEVPESDQIEFKERLSTKGDSYDRWITHRDRIGDRARNELLEEAVAFANAYGGALLLGIGESGNSPRVAARILPIPRCADLAERLKLKFRDCVEPQIPMIEIFAVPTDGDCGVVVIRTGPSRMAPHRVNPTRKCTIRRSDRCEEMAMREIQDLTLNLSRGLERLDRRLEDRSKRFVGEFDCLKNPDYGFGIRATAAPVDDTIRFDRVHDEKHLVEPMGGVLLNYGIRQVLLGFPSSLDHWRPMMRATRSDSSANFRYRDLSRNCYREIHCDGLLELGLVSCGRTVPSPRSIGLPDDYRGDVYLIQSDWPVNMFANVARSADRVRNAASTPTSEYALDVEILLNGNYAATEYGSDQANEDIVLSGGPRTGQIRFPRYSLGDSSEIRTLLTQFEEDYWSFFGKDISSIRGPKLVIEGYP